jgi:hypothetical protein
MFFAVVSGLCEIAAGDAEPEFVARGRKGGAGVAEIAPSDPEAEFLTINKKR